jgi:hypothetical protein
MNHQVAERKLVARIDKDRPGERHSVKPDRVRLTQVFQPPGWPLQDEPGVTARHFRVADNHVVDRFPAKRKIRLGNCIFGKKLAFIENEQLS